MKTPTLSTVGDATHHLRRGRQIDGYKRTGRHDPPGPVAETIVPLDPIPPMDVGLSGRRNAHTPVMEAFRSYFRQTFFIPTVR